MDILNKHASRHEAWHITLIMLAGIVIWFLHQNTVYALNSVSCKWGWFSYRIAGLPALQFVEALITLIALVLLLRMIQLAWRHWRRFQSQKPSDNPHMLEDTEKGSRPLLAFVAMLLNSLFCLFVLATFVPVFALNVCGQV